MSPEETNPTAIGQVIEGFGEIYPRELLAPYYRVLSTRNGSITAYHVNTETLSCSCPDQEWNREEPEVCDHLAVTLFEAEGHSPTVTVEGLQLGTTDHKEDEPTQESGQEPLEDDDLDSVAELFPTVNQWLRDIEIGTDHITLGARAHDGEPGITVDWLKDDLGERDHEWLKKKINDLEGSTYHAGWMDDGCRTCGSKDGEGWYHIPTATARGLSG